MKVQPYNNTAKRAYPALAKVAALVAVSCAMGACQQQPVRFLGEAPFCPEKIAVAQASQDAKGSARAHASDRPNIAPAKGKPAMTGRARVEPQTPVQGD
ncbi:hypothetical protein [Akkermansia glycaniphila]|uniref:hypothetical protein n=1 Tax=Akkermansia glycaniphila TaxID=1679444 RepID=UPI0011461B08|nr:hypothetical protein [Akkermansia glycaniphila]